MEPEVEPSPAPAGEPFIRLPIVSRCLPDHLRDLFEALLEHYTEPDVPIVITRERLAKRLGCTVGNLRRNMAALKSYLVPGKDYPFIQVVGGGPRTKIFILARPKSARRKPGPECRPETAPKRAPQGARFGCHKPNGGNPIGNSPSLNSGETLNVNVLGFSEKPPACAREGTVPGPSPDPIPPARPTPVVAAAPADGVDPELAGLTADQLRDRLAVLRAAVLREPRPGVKAQLWEKIGAACQLLDALEPAQEPAPTPKVQSLGPPVADGATPPPAARPGPALKSLLGDLERVAGPGPVESFARYCVEQLKDGHSMGMHRMIAEGVRDGLVDPRVVETGMRLARSPTADYPPRVYTNHVLNYSPRLDRERHLRRRGGPP